MLEVWENRDEDEVWREWKALGSWELSRLSTPTTESDLAASETALIERHPIAICSIGVATPLSGQMSDHSLSQIEILAFEEPRCCRFLADFALIPKSTFWI
jgi:hypothetical protein